MWGKCPLPGSTTMAAWSWTALADRAADPVDVHVQAGCAVGFGAVAVWCTRIEDAELGE